MTEIGICCINVQGLQNKIKRSDVFDRLRTGNFSIICIVDSHFDKSNEKIYAAEWGYSTYFSSFSSQSRGVAVLFKNDFEFKIHRTHRDNNGNLLILDIELEKRRITLAVVYGPNQDNPNFYKTLQKTISQFGNLDIICVGD